MSITSDKLIETLITQEPKGPGEIKLEFINTISVKELFSFCMELFNEISKYKYGNSSGQVDISTWSLDTIAHITSLTFLIWCNYLYRYYHYILLHSVKNCFSQYNYKKIRNKKNI
jgi:hypothetical protein